MKRLFCVLVLLAAVAGAQAVEPLRIGSKRFTESYILAHLMARQVQGATASSPSPVAPEIRQGLGNTAIVYEALRSGGIDLYPEYAGTIALEILKSPTPLDTREMNRRLAPLGLAAAIPLGFNNGYALAMREADAARMGLRTLSDLARQPQLKLGLSNEFIGRADGWKGLAARYGLRNAPTALDHGLAYDAIAARQIDVIDIYTTDARIGHLGLRVLQDDLGYFPRYDAMVLHRLEVPQRFPAAWAALAQLGGRIDEGAMIAMNARAELQGVAFETIAGDFLAASPGAVRPGSGAADAGARGFIGKLFGPDLGALALQHLMLVAASVASAALIAIPLAVWGFRRPRVRAWLLGATGLLQTVPSLALLAILISALGVIGTVPALLALTLYALLPIMRNTVTGLGEVPAGVRQAATALGMTPRQRMRLVELPLALPTVIAGVRTATTIAIGTATIAAFVGAGGFGERIVTGLALNDSGLLLAGAIPAAAMALLGEALFERVERAVRRRRGRA